ncbi:proline-, glutamic acid- and leucine-rich protein 1 [Salarias fasciatus]|uniref:proline-, glutamic acid- and leucine-rich protein 1 n=1 Tax=Salarias fasciatus TaxID=181472 RepID=UPI001176E803|nr:proline-, glutamic acid- and leucine-rich protein 1-like [Salarias fasciatus]
MTRREDNMAASWLHGPSVLRLTDGLVSVLKEQRPEHVPALLACYREHGAFSSQGSGALGGLVGFSNAKLGSNKTRFEGLCLLSMLVKDSSSDLFQQHCLSWLRSLQQIIQSQAPVQTVQLAVNVLKDVLQYSSQLAELAREVGLNSILGILTSLMGLKTECELAAMEGMTACMTFYPRACGSLRDKLGAYVLSKMDSTNRKTQEMACQCFGRLPCLGGLLDRGLSAGRAEAWTNQIHCLLASANGLLSQMYQGAETDGALQYQGPGVELPFPHLDQTDPLLLLQLLHRYTAVCLALKHTLRVDPATAVRLPARRILNTVCRALAVSSKSINLTGDGSVRLLVLPAIHTNTLEVLAGLITSVRGGLVQYAAVLQRLFSQTLSSWTPLPEASVGQQRAFSSVRVSVYKTLALWVQVGGASTGVLQGSQTHSELLFNHLLGDITPSADSVKLRGALSGEVVAGGKPGPRRTKQLVIADGMGPALQRKGDLVANQDSCLSALKALRHIILTSGTLLKDDVHKRLHDVVLPLCVRLQQQQSSSAALETAGGVSGPYGSALSRRELYSDLLKLPPCLYSLLPPRLLLALVLVPSPSWPPPVSCATSILSKGRIDRNLKVTQLRHHHTGCPGPVGPPSGGRGLTQPAVLPGVSVSPQVSSFCAEALTVCNCILHPRTPSISLPLPPLALKPTPAAPVMPPSQGPGPGLTLPTTLLGSSAPGPPFPSRHSLGLGPGPGPASLLGSLENHLSLVPGLPGQGPGPGDLLLSPHAHHQPELGPPEGQRPVFVRYDKEEAEDVEISLDSDSDDSVVIVPPGMLGADGQQDEAAPPNSHSVLSAAPGDAGAPPPGGDGASMAPPAAAPSTVDGSSLHNDLASSSPLLPTSTAPINSFPPSVASVVSLVPPLNSGALAAPPGGLGDPLPGRPQLQQMLMQPPPPGQPPSVGLPLQMHQLQNQLGPPGRHLHPHPPPPPANNEDSAEEEDEEGGIPPLEGGDDKESETEDGKVLRAPVDEGGPSGFGVEGEPEAGIEEVQTSRTLFGEDRMKVQEVESIGVLEAAREAEGEAEEDADRMDDPTMPQILCVTGGTMEEQEEEPGDAAAPEEEEEEEAAAGGSWEGGAKPGEPSPAAEEERTAGQQEPAVQLVTDADMAATPPGGRQEQEEPPAAPPPPSSSSSSCAAEQLTQAEKEEEGEEEEEEPAGEGGDGGESDGQEGKGLKRKREEVDDEAMASMLADFVACPPDDEEGASGSGRS